MGKLDLPVRRETYDHAFKACAAALRDAGIDFACMGSLALWALGGPSPNLQQDLDFAICEQDAAAAAVALRAAGFTVEVPEEDWLFKAWSGEPYGRDSALIDLIYSPAGIEVTPELLGACEVRSILAMEVRVIDATDLLVTKLHALTEQMADFSSILQFARSLREQVDWDALADRVHGLAFGESFLVLVDHLALRPGSEPPSHARLGRRGCAALPSHPGRLGVLDVLRAGHDAAVDA